TAPAVPGRRADRVRRERRAGECGQGEHRSWSTSVSQESSVPSINAGLVQKLLSDFHQERKEWRAGDESPRVPARTLVRGSPSATRGLSSPGRLREGRQRLRKYNED